MDFDSDREQRYASVARYIDQHLPANAAFISMQHSGSLRYYARRLTVRYDLLDGPDLSRAVALLKQRGYRPYILLEDWEEVDFRRRFQRDPLSRLDFGVLATYPHYGSVRLYDPESPGHGTGTRIPHLNPVRCGLLGLSLRAAPPPR
jgi:hypothetical protein